MALPESITPDVLPQQDEFLTPSPTSSNTNAGELNNKQAEEWTPTIKWSTSVSIVVLHLLFLWSFWLSIFLWRDVCLLTYIWGYFLGAVAGFGVTGGAHRLWTHRSYQAKLPLKIILLICFTMAGQNTLFQWVRDHRVHHKFSETDADPHNSNRGFFFAHVGWLMMKKHPEVLRKGRQIDMSDILSDPLINLHTKYFIPLKLLLCFILPTIIPPLVWGETWFYSFMGMCVVRYTLMLNIAWLVNSAAHLWGTKPFERRINAVENRTVSFLALGEGWHNYHHIFPWDYKAAELGNYSFNLTTFWLDLFAKIGWAYDLKCPSKELVKRVAERYGDGSHPEYGHHMQEIGEEEDTNMEVLNPSKQLSNSKSLPGVVAVRNGTANKPRHMISNMIIREKYPLDTTTEVPECVAQRDGELKFADKKCK